MNNAARFRRRFHTELVGAFNLADLTKLAQLEMNVTLANVVYAQSAFENVAFEFVGWCHRQGRMGELVASTANSRPGLAVFQALLQEFNQLPPDSTLSVKEFQRFAALFDKQIPNLNYLKAYKELHEILHDLDGKIASFEAEANARTMAGIPIPSGTVDYLRLLAAQAKKWLASVEFPEAIPWVGRFDSAVEAFSSDDASKHVRAFRYLENLPAQELRLLNRLLVDCARRVEVVELEEIVDWRLDGLPELSMAVTEFRKVCVRLRDLISSHDWCQLIDSELREVENEIGLSPNDIHNWEEVRGWLDKLRTLRTSDLVMSQTLAAAAKFDSANTPGPVDPFAHLMEKFVKLFETVDKELLDTTQPLLTTAFRLANHLRNPQ